jgi:hypothetical protein
MNIHLNCNSRFIKAHTIFKSSVQNEHKLLYKCIFILILNSDLHNQPFEREGERDSKFSCKR